MEKLKFAVLISGRGSNLQSLIEACREPTFPAEIAIVISNEPNAPGIGRAKQAGLPTKVINHRKFGTRKQFDSEMTKVIANAEVELICLAGFMRVLSKEFIHHWWNKIINIHPSLLPAFKGLNVQARAIQSGVKFSGCTIHFVREGVDEGPIICQAVVPIHETDDVDTLTNRILEQEYLLYPAAVSWIAKGQLHISVERVYIRGTIPPKSTITNPSLK